MFGELRDLHDRLVGILRELEVLTGTASPDRALLSDARFHLSKTSRQRTRLLEEGVYPFLVLQFRSEAMRIEELRSESVRNTIMSADHIATWSIDNIVNDWTGYQLASATIRASMRRRITKERAIVYPLLEKFWNTEPNEAAIRQTKC